MTPRVSVVILNWNGLEHLEECFSALHGQSFTDFEIIFVDNASSDNSVGWVRQHEPAARVIQRSDNGGFARGVNDGIRVSSAEYVALLNNDTLAEPGWLAGLVKALDENACYGAAASRMMLFAEPGMVNSAGDVFRYWRLAGVNRGLGEPAEHYLTRQRVFGASAGAALYRRSFFDRVGLFDGDFFLLHEDTDLNLRATVIGERFLYVPEAVVQHKHHGSLGRQPQRELQIREWRNKAVLSAKSLPQPLHFFAPAVLTLAVLRWSVPLRPANWHLAPERLGMLAEIAREAGEGWADGMRKRADVLVRRKVSSAEARRWILKGVGPYEECSSS